MKYILWYLMFHANLVEHHPVGVYLGVTLGVQHHRLVLPEVSQGHLCVLRTHVDGVHDGVVVEVRLTHVPHTIT